MPDDDELTDDQQRMDDVWLALVEFAGLHFWYDRRWHEQFIQHNDALFMRWAAEDAARRERRPTEVRVAALVRECLVSDQPDALTD
jgi:hypothetical protein